MAAPGIAIENPLVDLEKKIKDGQNVSEAEVHLAFDKEEQAVQTLYDQLKEPANSLVRQDHMDRLKAYRKTVLKEAKDLRNALSGGRLKIFAESVKLRAQLDPRVSNIQAKHQRFEQARIGARTVTDPDGANALFADYEGYSITGKGMDDENANNKTRWTLSGYLAGLQINDPALAGAEITKAKEIYENSRFHGNYGDKCFNYEHLEKDMGLAPYLLDLKNYGFSDETNGLLAAYLKIAEGFGVNKENYRAYFFAELDKLKAGGGFNYPPIPGEKENMKNFNAAQFEISKLENGLMWPREWLDNISALQEVFERLKTDATVLTTSLGFPYVDKRVIDLLSKNKDQITPDAKDEIIYVKSRVRDEGYVALLRTNADVTRSGAAVDTKFAEISTKNAKAGKFTAQEMAAVKATIDDAKKDLGNVTLAQTATLDDLIEQNGFLTSARQKLGNAMTRLNAMEIELNKQPQPKPAPTPAPVPTPEKPKPAPEKKEDAEFLAFLREKNLMETKLGNGKDCVYDYMLNPANIKAKINDNGSPVFDYGNRDVNMILWRVNRMMDSIFGNLIDENGKKAIEKIAADESMSMAKRGTLIVHYYIDRLGNRLDAEGEKKMKAIEKMFGKFGEISMRFNSKPTLSTLKSAYESDFLEQWRNAAKDLVGLEGPAKKPKKKGSVEVPKELNFLGPVYLQYVDILVGVDRFGKNPERFPEGVNLNLRINNADFWSRFQYTGEPSAPYKLFFNEGSLAYSSVEQFMRALNAGTVHQQIADMFISRKKTYKAWEGYIGEADKAEKLDGPNWTHLELDWDNPDPDISIEAMPHGKIRYIINRENIGVRGEEKYEGYADNFYDFILQLRHLKQWAKADEHKPVEDLASRKESAFRGITDFRIYKNTIAEKNIGRVISMQIRNDEHVFVVLDWGGGNDPANKNNAVLEIGVNQQGGLTYFLQGHGIGENRGVSGSVYTMEQLMVQVKQKHDEALS